MSGKNDEQQAGEERTEIRTNPSEVPARQSSGTENDDKLDCSIPTHEDGATLTADSPQSDVDSFGQTIELKRELIGRYRVKERLGAGGYGQVYLASDDELRRKVTIKIPLAHRVANSKAVDAFLTEARTLAKLEHPNVVPVHDVGHTEDGICFIVSRYIDGSDLFQRIKKSPLQVAQAVELIATIAEALHYVHSMGVIHRDIKPGNILLDKRGTAYLADFGLALLEEDAARTSRIAGTPAYMSPEQARGENHLVTGRSDIFSLGIVLYQLITGKRPFGGSNSYAVSRMIQEQEAQPPSELNPDVSPELERICLKALSKRSNARHATGIDLANDLRFLLSNPTQAVAGHEAAGDPDAARPIGEVADTENSRTNRRATGLIPRGLRSFGSQDAHFFTDLLPGPYERDGMPESILFWKRRIEERDPEITFRLGLIYGPSGCGKSSFCKAGLIPTLQPDVIPIFIEAAPEATETRLINRIRRKCPYLDTKLGLRESIAALRHQNVMGEGTKILLIIDQFEQWLYSTQQPEHSELAKALRQCDGEHVQCILLVRDDFWLAFSRFMEHVEVDLLQNHNMALIDLFDIEHAKLVLREFGRAYERLPQNTSDMTRDERSFIDQAIDGLSENGKVIPVRIALFAEMIKSRRWSTATLRHIGGTKGVGVLFLEENFSSSNAPAEHAVHLEAVYQTLGALLPQPGTNLKGHMRSREELLAISGYVDQPKQFQSLIRTLDNDLHLITRTTQSGRGDISSSQSGSFSNLQSGDLVQGEFYQLAHDYLVPAIREWQVRTQRGTRRGRAEIRLTQRAEIWGTRPESRHLPTMTEWMAVHALTAKKRWSETERKMMRSAGRRHGMTLVAVALLLVAGVFGFRQYAHWNRANSLTQQLEVAEPKELVGLLDELETHGRWSLNPLKSVQLQNPPGTTKHLYSSLALLRIGAEDGLPGGEDEIAAIKPVLLSSDPETLRVLCSELKPYRETLADYLWKQVEDDSLERATNQIGRPFHPRLNAMMALANFDPPGVDGSEDDRWNRYAEFAAEELIHFANIDRTNFSQMVDLVQPAADPLVEPLADVMISAEVSESTLRKSAAQDLLVRLLEQQVPEYVDILLGAEVEQILASIDLIDKNFENVRPVLDRAIAKPIRIEDENWTQFALRKATAAALLLRHDVTTPEVWAVLVPDTAQPAGEEVSENWMRTELQRLLPSKQWEPLNDQGDLEAMRQRYREVTLGRESIPNARTRLVQRVRMFDAKPVPMARKLLVEQDLDLQIGLIQALGEFEPTAIEASLRSKVITLAKGWVLSANSAVIRGNAFWLLQQWDEKEWANEQFVLSTQLRDEDADWYVNSIGQSMVRLPQHEPSDSYRIEVAAAETTLGQLKAWQRDGVEEFKWSGEDDRAAAGNVTYHECIAFCNWLSRHEELGEDQVCYSDRDDPNDPPARIFDDYKSRTGYRLPMAEEWYFACSSGTITDYSFGSGRGGPGTLEKRLYDGFVPTQPTGGKSSWSVGAARPNPFGIFDMYCNVREWANDLDPNDTTRVQLCGFDFRYHLGMRGVEPRFLGWSEPNSSRSFYGFRLFRSRPASASKED
ncbi:MAG: protein kinase domain-containing protein [Rubripirellula sp.]